MKRKFPFSRRTNWPLNANPLSMMLQSLREKNIPVIDLTESNPTRCGFRYPTEKILSSLADPRNMLYAPCASGSPDARAAVSRYYRRKGFAVDPQRIVLTASTSEAYSTLFRLLLNPGDHVLVGQPSYPLFEFLLELNDARMESYPLIYEKDQKAWRIDLKALEKAVGRQTRVIMLVNPNNPTGSFVNQQELAVINQLCLQQQIALICDEVFSDYVFQENPQRVLSLVSNSDVLTFSLGGISKCLGLPQMKCGWIVAGGPAALVNESLARLEVIADTYLSVNAPVQNALSQWLDGQEEISKEIRQRLKQNWESLGKAVGACGSDELQYLNCEGGWYAILKLPSGKFSEEEWAMEFLHKDHVFVHPGYFFDFPTPLRLTSAQKLGANSGTSAPFSGKRQIVAGALEEPLIVLSLLPAEETFKLGLERILRRIVIHS